MARRRSRTFTQIIGNIVKAPGRLVGEISKLRQTGGGFGIRIGGGSGTYTLDSSRVDYKLARALYKNEEDDYKLGAGFARPIINTAVGFMGVPSFRCEDEEAQAALEDFFSNNVSLQQETHRNALRDGDCWVWITREEDVNTDLYPEVESGARLIYNLLPPEQVSDVIRDPLTGKVTEYILVSNHEWVDAAGNKKKAKVTQRISAEFRKIEVEGDTPPDIEVGEHVNQWGFIPIVHFANERESSAAFGRSDLEPIEPYLKAYHDVMIHAMKGNKLHSTPKLRLKLKNVAAFLLNNFGVDDPVKFAREGRTLTLDGRELILLEDQEDADFIEVKSATGSAKDLLKLLFLCIVDTSETPEFAMGAATSASHASVKEQMPVLVRRIARKREFFTNPWQDLARIVLAMTSMATGRKFDTHATTLVWDAIVERDEKETAETLNTIVEALARAMEADLISMESAVAFLSEYVDTMSDWLSNDPESPGEREKIIRTKLLRARLDDAELAEKEEEEIEKILKDLEDAA